MAILNNQMIPDGNFRQIPNFTQLGLTGTFGFAWKVSLMPA
jgi:hypothetical protein